MLERSKRKLQKERKAGGFGARPFPEDRLADVWNSLETAWLRNGPAWEREQ